MSTRLSDYRYDLPDELIARRPLPERASSRLLVLRRGGGPPEHRRFPDVVDLLREGDALVVNDTTVLPARLFGEKAGTGGRVEVLLVRALGDGRWLVLLQASKKPKPGGRIVFGSDSRGFDDLFFGTVEGPSDDEPGAWVMRFEGDVLSYAQAAGRVPLPPYLQRDDEDDDRERYQTVFRDEAKPYSSAAPTAGLHFDEALLSMLGARGVRLVKVTLHVGPGTFLPVREDDLAAHRMHAEPWWVTDEAARTLNETRAAGGRIVAVGTTSARALETAAAAASPGAPLQAGEGLTRLFIRPGHVFRAVDALITNFHLPESTLLMLVAAAVGRERILRAYEEAVRERYRFFSYGDACFLEIDDEARRP